MDTRNPVTPARVKRAVAAVGCLWVVALVLPARPAAAHAVLVESTPARGSTVSGPDMAIRLRFNVRIDASRSRLSLLRKDGSIEKLDIEKQSSVDTLTAQATALKPGPYRVRWQVLAPDGHITSGEIIFFVKAP